MSPAAPPTSQGYRWVDGELVEHAAPHLRDARSGQVLVADSWLVSDGSTLAIDLHRARFMAGVEAAAAGAAWSGTAQPGSDETDAFWSAAIAAIPRTGDWFPRVDLVTGDSPLRFTLRPAPPRSTSIRLVTHDGPDPRSSPTVKGPDLERLGVLRRAAQERGMDDAVLLSPDGLVVEGAYCALAWWRGDALCVPDPSLPRVDSVTAKTLTTVASALGVEVREELARPADLEGLEIWALNALHGIRIVTAWANGPLVAQEPGRLALWRRRFGGLSRPIGTLDA
ncbi:aminotransferase class IV [Marisediminicola senii]|uniref:aminotransferase class IV n=1 Tax=Marisediminicola senii TaxID=2711233 RepID=UPI0013EAD366|nr:aminotransferase class IV [Marisediminicola senii]